MKSANNRFHPESIDADIDLFLLSTSQEDDTTRTNACFIRSMKDVYMDESQILERAWRRLTPQMQSTERKNRMVRSEMSQQAKTDSRLYHIHDYTSTNKNSRQKGTLKRLSIFGSGLVAAVLIISAIITFTAYQQNQAATLKHQQTQATTSAEPASTATPQWVAGPESQYIKVVGLAFRIDKNNQPGVPSKTIKPGQPIYLILNVQPLAKQNGTVDIKWYQNGQPFVQQSKAITNTVNEVTKIAISMQYAQPAAGKVEIYWQGKLAWTIYFTVK